MKIIKLMPWKISVKTAKWSYICATEKFTFIKHDVLGNMDGMSAVLVLEVKPSIDEGPIYIPNVYNTLIRRKPCSDSAEIVMGAIRLPRKYVFIMRDPNLHYSN